MATPIKAIRAKCLDCSCGNVKEVTLCPITRCPLYPFRFGKNPNIQLTSEERAARAARLQKLPSQQGDSAVNLTTESIYTTGTNAAKRPPSTE